MLDVDEEAEFMRSGWFLLMKSRCPSTRPQPDLWRISQHMAGIHAARTAAPYGLLMRCSADCKKGETALEHMNQ